MPTAEAAGTAVLQAAGANSLRVVQEPEEAAAEPAAQAVTKVVHPATAACAEVVAAEVVQEVAAAPTVVEAAEARKAAVESNHPMGPAAAAAKLA